MSALTREADDMSMVAGLVYLALGTVASVAYFTVPGMEGNGLVFSLIGLSAAAAIVVGALRNRPRHILPWMLFAAAQVSFVIGDLLYYAFHFDFPSVGDVFYLAVYPLLVAGLLVLIRARSAGRDRGSLLDASVITVGLGLLAWVFLIEPYTQLEGLGGLARLMSIAYPLMDVLLLAVTARLAMSPGARSPSFYLIGLGIVSLLATDSAYGYIELHTGYGQGGLLDAGWLAYYLLWGTAALLPGMRRLDEPAAGVRPTLTGGRLVPLAAATLIAPAVAIIESIADSDSTFSVASVASAVLFLLVLARMTGLVRSLRLSVDDEHRALFREGVLRRAAVSLGGAPDRGAVEQATLEAAEALIADAGGISVRVGLTSVPTSSAGTAAGASGADESTLQIPIATQAFRHGSIWVSGAAPLTPPVVSSLGSLGAQAAVALERAALADDLLRRRSDERMAAIVQQASEVITVLDADLVVRHQTASAGRFLRYDSGTLTGRRLLELVHPDDFPVANTFFADLAAQPGVRPETEFRLRGGDGSWVNIEALGNNLLQDPRVHGIVVTIRDVTKRKVLEEGLRLQVNELTQLDRLKSDLVSTVSHELRTPLTTLVGHVEMLSDGDFGELSEDQRWAVGAIHRNSQRLLSLIEDMLTLAKIENGGLSLTVAPTDLQDLFAEIEAAAAPLARAKSIDLRLELSAGVPSVLADRAALERAIMNLLSNAVKFTPEGGMVNLGAWSDQTNATFSVSDTGMGMSADDTDRLFTRFFRSPTAMSMAIPGTGLGLAIVKKIVDDHGGAIHVESAPDAGTTVEFTIPLSTPAPRAGVPHARPSPRDEAAAALA